MVYFLSIRKVHINNSKVGAKRMVPDSFQLLLPSDRRRSSGHKIKHKKLHLNTRKNFSMLRVAGLWSSAQGECGVFLSTDIPDPPGCVPVSLFQLTLPGLSDLQRYYPAQMILRFCVVSAGRCQRMGRALLSAAQQWGRN